MECVHGTRPVPAPTLLEFLKRGKLYLKEVVKKELLTPIGAAILAHFVMPVEVFPQSRVVLIVYEGRRFQFRVLLSQRVLSDT